jgi:HAD superfamily hydrolase (TIGR01509 family)
VGGPRRAEDLASTLRPRRGGHRPDGAPALADARAAAPSGDRGDRRLIRVVFLDDGGVLNDNERRGAESRRLVGEYFAPRLGGTKDQWIRANVTAFERAWARFVATRDAGEQPPYTEFVDSEAAIQLRDTCELVGVEPPADAAAVAREAATWICERVDAAYPDAVPAVRALAARGLKLHTASGALSTDLDGYLRGMGVREHFDRLYGPDLVGTWKVDAHFYRAIVADSGADPRTALVVDDSAAMAAAAREAGLDALHLARDGSGDLRSLTELVTRLS